AADADMVFGVVAEELGLIIAVICILVMVVFGIFAIRASATARSSFYVIAAGATVTIFLSQMILNVFGALDIIPFTGITFPFVSRGGSSMLASWALLAFIKAADTRQNASLAVKLDRRAMRQAEGGVYADEPFAYDDGYDDNYEPEADYGYEYEYEEEQGEPLDGGMDAYFFDDGWEDER
ncbi:MAG: FtsW/RodA/SpoVE family cell cycle protein, partial [Oscillospiraceae bacterium]|nr:FtsW/RodA/SpoVE family cell cycle protein [Oscillospiraceae bacterium]